MKNSLIKKKFQSSSEKVDYITNSLRLLSLPHEVLELIETKKITPGHAKIIVGLENAYFIANKIIEKKLSVRQTENFVKIFKKKKKVLLIIKILILKHLNNQYQRKSDLM